MRFCIALVSILLIALSGCGEETSPVQESDITSVDTITVMPSDTIGVLMGDSNYVFGTIGDVLYTSEGNIAVLDETGCCVKVFDPSGEFIMQMGREGSGPGEMLHPGAMVLFSEGSIGVLDQPTGGLHSFNADGTFNGLYIDFQGQAVPQWAWGVDNYAFVGAITDVHMQDDALMASFIIGRWEDSPEPSVIYFEYSFPFDPSDMTSFLENTFFSTAYAADRDGVVYVAPISSTEYRIDIFSSDGSLLSSIERDMPRVEKSPEEIEEEIAMITAILIERGVPDYMIDYQPDPYRWLIPPQSIGADGMERVWVQNGAVDGSIIDVYSRDGEHLAVVVIEGVLNPDILDVVNYKIQPQGILAYSLQDPEYPRIYVIPMPDIR
ncbi:MAG: 6-bladed beta-propeller [Bacteroidales bacterium]|nr:6-bladed beta-propeller [Bacteroidales bacterium]